MHAQDTALAHLRASDCVEEEAVGRERGKALRSAMVRLPPAQRRVIELAFFDGLTHLQVADRLAIPLGTVKGLRRLGMEKLRGQIAA